MLSFLEMARARRTQYVDYSLFQRVYQDIPYGENPREKMDIFLPTGNGPFPVVLQVTGGGWVYGDKSMIKMQEMFLTCLQRGYAVASMNYSLSDQAKFPVPILQVKAAVRFLRMHAEEYALDERNFFLYGNSAGGYLVLMAAYTDEREPFYDAPRPGQEGVSSRVSAVADIYGITQLSHNREMILSTGLEPKYFSDDIRSCEGYFMGFDTRTCPELITAASPITYARAGCPPTLLQHGRMDHTVSVKQSYDLVQKLLSVNEGKVEWTYFDELDHSDPFFKSAENTHRIMDFFDRWITH